jgi:hypothetical protein
MANSAGVSARVVEHLMGLRELAPQWWALLDRAVHPQATQTPLWIDAWCSIFGQEGGRQLRVVVVETASGEVVGILPLLRRWVVRDAVIPVPTLELLGSGEAQEDEICSEYIGAIVARGYEAVVARAFAEILCSDRLGSWDELSMQAMSGDDPMVPLLATELRNHSIGVQLHMTQECPFVPLPKTWDEYLGRLDGQKRYFARRTLRDLETWAGPDGLVLRRAETEAELARGWDILQTLHSERWQGAGAFRSERFRRFHGIVTSRMLRGEGGTLDLLWLEARGTPIAAAYNIVYAGKLQFYQAGRTLDVPKHIRPGIALQLMSIRRAIERGYLEFDFLGRADQYKQQLAPSDVHKLINLSAIAPTMRARASKDVRRTARKIVELARDFAVKHPPFQARLARTG